MFFLKNNNLPIHMPPLRTSRLQKKPSTNKREHPAVQNMKFLNFFLFFVGHCCPPGSEYGSTDLIKSGPETLDFLTSIYCSPRTCSYLPPCCSSGSRARAPCSGSRSSTGRRCSSGDPPFSLSLPPL